MISSILHITSQVEKSNSIDSESKSVKRSADHQNCLPVYFYMLLQYQHTVRKHFWLEQSALTPSAGWLSMRNCFNRLEDSGNYSAGVLQTNVAKNMSSIAGRGIKSQMLYVSQQSSLVCYDDHNILCILIVPPCIVLG